MRDGCESYYFNFIRGTDKAKMFASKGKTFGVFVLLISILLIDIVDAKGRVVPRFRKYPRRHSSSTRSCPSLLLVAALLIVSLNAAKVFDNESEGRSRRLEAGVHKEQLRTLPENTNCATEHLLSYKNFCTFSSDARM